MEKRALRKVREGVVVSDKMDKTITVAVETRVQHPLYKKFIRKTTKFKAHDGENQARNGDVVRLMETRPLSKDKRCRFVQILKKAE